MKLRIVQLRISAERRIISSTGCKETRDTVTLPEQLHGSIGSLSWKANPSWYICVYHLDRILRWNVFSDGHERDQCFIYVSLLTPTTPTTPTSTVTQLSSCTPHHGRCSPTKEADVPPNSWENRSLLSCPRCLPQVPP